MPSREIINIQVKSLFLYVCVSEPISDESYYCNRLGKLATRYNHNNTFRCMLGFTAHILVFLEVGESFWQMLLAEHGLDSSGVSTKYLTHLSFFDCHAFLLQFRHTMEQTHYNLKGYETRLSPFFLFFQYHLADPLFFCLFFASTKQTGVYFDEVTGSGATRYVPRSVQVDLEAGVCNKV